MPARNPLRTASWIVAILGICAVLPGNGYAESAGDTNTANAVLFESIDYLKDKRQEAGQTAEVALTIIRILEALRQNQGISSGQAFTIVKKTGLSQYLSDVSSQSR